MREHSIYYAAGVVVGMALVAIVALVMKKVLKLNSRCQDMDERQLLVQGKAYQVGFFAMMIANVLYGGVCEIMEFSPLGTFGGTFACMCVGLLFFAGYSIFHDAYYGIHDSSKKYMLIFGMLFVVMTCNTIRIFSRGEGFVNGGLESYAAIELTMAVTMAAVLIMTLIKKLMKRENEGGEEE